MRGSRKFCQRGSKSDKVFFWVFSGERGIKIHQKRAIIGLSAKRHWNGVSLAGRWWPNIECVLSSFGIFGESGSVLLRNPLFCDISFGVRTPVPLSGSAYGLVRACTIGACICNNPRTGKLCVFSFSVFNSAVCRSYFHAKRSDSSR